MWHTLKTPAASCLQSQHSAIRRGMRKPFLMNERLSTASSHSETAVEVVNVIHITHTVSKAACEHHHFSQPSCLEGSRANELGNAVRTYLPFGRLVQPPSRSVRSANQRLIRLPGRRPAPTLSKRVLEACNHNDPPAIRPNHSLSTTTAKSR